MVVQIFFLLMNLFFALAIFYLTIAFITGAPFVPSNEYATKSMINFASLKPGMKIYDLGSGDGRLVIEAAKHGAYAVGFEINPFLVIWSNLRILLSHQEKLAHVYWKNFWRANLTDADVVFVYLLPWRMETLSQLLDKQLKKNTIIISNSFIFPKWNVYKKDQKNHIYAFKVA